MTKDQLTDLYRRKEEQRKINAKLPIAEKMAIAVRLHEAQEKLGPIRNKNTHQYGLEHCLPLLENIS